MAEQTFRSPGFFEREIDLSQRESEIVGVPAGVVGTAEMAQHLFQLQSDHSLILRKNLEH